MTNLAMELHGIEKKEHIGFRLSCIGSGARRYSKTIIRDMGKERERERERRSVIICESQCELILWL